MVGWEFLAQTNIFQHVGPLAHLSSVTVFEMLSEVIGSEEFFSLVAFSELVDVCQVVDPAIPVGLR